LILSTVRQKIIGLPPATPTVLLDPQGRHINYLRLSVTDRCNLRCRYCMPAQGMAKVGHDEILNYEDLLRIARAAVAIGVEKIRVTGGEPLVRRGIVDFLRQLASIPGLQRLVLTTNGMLLTEMADHLRAAGVESVNISLDSLKPETFALITRGGNLRQVLAGIAAAESAGFRSIKINVVVMRGVNDGELEDFAALTLNRPWRVRFIEYMPTLSEPGWAVKGMPGSEILERLSRRFTMVGVASENLAGPARYQRIAGAAGLVGVITPVSCHFCSECNRIRVTSRGSSKSCLFGRRSIDLRPMLAESDDVRLREGLRRTVAEKPDRHQLSAGSGVLEQIAMAGIGG